MTSWVLIIWLASPSNFTVYEKFKSEEDCLNKMSTVQNALQQASSKMQVSCRNQKPGDEIIVLDIDQIIVNNIDEMINWPVGENELISYKKWWKTGDTNKGNTVKLNGGWYKFKSGSLKCVWDKFSQSPKSIEKWQTHYFNNGTVHFKYYGEQNFVEDTCVENNIKITHMPGEWICKYTNNKDSNLMYSQKYMQLFNQDHMILYKPNSVLKIVHFAGAKLNDTIHDCTDNWIKDYWQ